MTDATPADATAADATDAAQAPADAAQAQAPETTANAAQQAAHDDVDGDDAGDHDGDRDEGASPADGGRAARDAARYRTQLRETEAERDQLADRVDGLLRREVNRLAADRLAQADDLLALGPAALADLLDDETGTVDPAKVTAAVDALLEDRPGLRKVDVRRGPSGLGLGGHGSHARGAASWSDVLKNT